MKILVNVYFKVFKECKLEIKTSKSLEKCEFVNMAYLSL